MGGLIFLAILAIPVAELFVIVQVAEEIGILSTFALLVAISFVGAYLLKQQGMATWRRMQGTLQRGEMPANEVTDGAMILMGGALLLTPGFLTDVVGILLLLPPTRAALKTVFRRSAGRWARRRAGMPGRPRSRMTYDARVIKVERTTSPRPPSDDPSRPSRPPGERPAFPEDGSPDKE
jgi:UPF0716 protein FxsA